MYKPIAQPNLDMENFNVTSVNGATPKGVPINAEWLNQFVEHNNPSLTAESQLSLYLFVSVMIVIFIIASIAFYCFCCVWILKGNLDLPNLHAGGETPKKMKICLQNPFPTLFPPRYPIDNSSRIEPAMGAVHDCLSSTTDRHLNTARVVAVAAINNAAEPVDLPTIPVMSCDPPDTSIRSILFDSRRCAGVSTSLKQFQQFKYETQDNEPEEVVFDVFDLRNDR